MRFLAGHRCMHQYARANLWIPSKYVMDDCQYDGFQACCFAGKRSPVEPRANKVDDNLGGSGRSPRRKLPYCEKLEKFASRVAACDIPRIYILSINNEGFVDQKEDGLNSTIEKRQKTYRSCIIGESGSLSAANISAASRSGNFAQE